VRILDPRLGSDSSHFRRNPAAYEPYLQAKYFLARGEDKEDLEKALGYVDQAIQLDPGFAPSWALRSLVINTAATIGLRDHEKSFLEARENAEKAIALDARSAAGYLALGWVKLGYEWDWDGDESKTRRGPREAWRYPSGSGAGAGCIGGNERGAGRVGETDWPGVGLPRTWPHSRFRRRAVPVDLRRMRKTHPTRSLRSMPTAAKSIRPLRGSSVRTCSATLGLTN
jgi:hypothetical protein